jgi:hypothetical protein
VALLNTTTNANDRSRLTDAITHLNKSINSNLWIDDSHPKLNKADGVFNEEKSVAQTLRNIRISNASGISVATMQGFIDTLVGVDHCHQ